MNKYNNIPIDVQNSITKLKKLIKIIEENKHIQKDSILREITIQLNITIEAARKLFSLYYPLEGSLSTYIVERKRTETIKVIIDMNDNTLIDRKIEEIANCSKAYFDRMLYKDYGVKIKDLQKNKNIERPFIKILDVDMLEANISNIYDFLYSLSEKGYIDIKRTKIKMNNIDYNVALKVIFSMREYVYFEEEKDLDKLISYDMFFQSYEQIQEHIDSSSNYNPLHIIDSYSNNQEETEMEKLKRKIDFTLCYNSPNNIEIGELTYYFVDRYKFKGVIDEFILPKELSSYKSVICKTKYVLRLLSRSESTWLSYAEEFKNMIDNDLEKDIFSYIVSKEEERFNIGSIYDMYLAFKDKYEKLKYEDIDKNMKNLILRGYISLKT